MSDGSIRIDVWLFHARICKSRSLAQRMCADGLVTVDGEAVPKPSRTVRPGSVVGVVLGRALRRFRVVAPGERRGPAPEARGLYEDMGSGKLPDDM
ncbi:MAG: RNA-binding S4 domain-containing protein [Alphaproteobacteria bacterium]